MENKESDVPLKKFVIKVIVVTIGLMAIAGFISISQDLNFGITLLICGVLLGGAGNLLGGPGLVNRYSAGEARIHNRPNEALSDRISNYLEHSIPHYGFENVMMYSGLIAIAISIPFLIIFMF